MVCLPRTIKEGDRMGRSIQTSTDLRERVRALLADELAHGWTVSRVASEMQYLGHKGWNENAVSMFARGRRLKLELDEGVAILAVFGGRARWVTQEIETPTKIVAPSAQRRESPKREGI